MILLQSPFTDTLPCPLYFRVATVPAHAAYPVHRHHWGEFVHAFSGVMEVHLHDRQGPDRHYLVPPQYGLWLPPEVEHQGLNRREACHSSFYVAPELAAGLPTEVCALALNPLLHALLDELRQQAPVLPYTQAQTRLLQVMLDQLALAPTAGSYLPTTDDPLLAPVLQALAAQPGDNRAVADWAATVHTTERTLMRRSLALLGMTLTEWRQRLRVVKAMPLLEEGLSVEHVAQDMGYASTSAFIAMFRKLMGVTPEEYRRRL